jgi:hypothetical protein
MSSLFFKFANQAPLYPKFVFAIDMIEYVTWHFNVVAVAVINWIVLVDHGTPIVPITTYNSFEFVLHVKNNDYFLETVNQ